MSSEQRIAECLARLGQSLQACGEIDFAEMVNRANDTGGSERDSFLTSNALWGGAGSIADQAGLSRGGGRTAERARIERVLIELGEEQIRLATVNQRTGMWVTAFKSRTLG